MDERQKPVVTSKVQSTSRVSSVSYGSGVEEGYSSQMLTRNVTPFLIIGLVAPLGKRDLARVALKHRTGHVCICMFVVFVCVHVTLCLLVVGHLCGILLSLFCIWLRAELPFPLSVVPMTRL